MMDRDTLDFSFSGLKTAVLNLTLQINASPDANGARDRADIAASFQEAIADVLSAKCVRAIKATGMRSLVVAGGVGANRRLRERIDYAAKQSGFRVFYPPHDLCTDNGAMVAFAGAIRIAQGQLGALAFNVRPRWELDSLPPISA